MCDEGIIALAEALKTNTTLTTLNVDGNDVGDDGAIALAEALKTNTTLTTLSLEYNEVHDDGVMDTIEQMMERNRYRVRLHSIVSALLPGSLSDLVDVLEENSDSLSTIFDLLRVKMDWV